MASGRQLSDENVKTFSAWVASKTDAEFREMAIRGVLSRTEIAKECSFSKSALDQNPRIKLALKELEAALRQRGVLPPAVAREAADTQVPPLRQVSEQRATVDAERTRRLEQENASLRAENGELKGQLRKYVILNDALTKTGRVLR